MTVTAGLAQSAIQAALYSLLSTDATLLALLPGGGVYDDVPEGTLAPFVAIGEWTETSDDDTLEDGNAGIGSDCTVTLHAYTDDLNGGGRYLTVQQIASRLKVLLHGTVLTLASPWTCVVCEHEDTTVFRDMDDSDRPKRHLISTYRIHAEAA